MPHHSQRTKKQKKKQPPGCGHLPAPAPAPIIDKDAAGPEYVFVVVSHLPTREDPFRSRIPLHEDFFCSILQLEINNPEYAPNLPPPPVNQNSFVAQFTQPQVGTSSITWLFSPPSGSTGDLYMLPDCTLEDYYIHVGAPLHGFKFNITNREFQPIIPPAASKLYGNVVNREERIYFMAHPDWYYEAPDPVFECYDTVENKWEAIEPFPDHAVRPPRCYIVATAVWDDTILYNMGGCKIWAYNVPKNKWSTVKVVGNRCYNIVGDAIVLENTIYALTDPEFSLVSVLALSIERVVIDGVDELKCSLLSQILVPGMDQIKFDDVDGFQKTRHLVHLGKDNFCLVQSCNFPSLIRYQPIQLTSIKLAGKKSMTVMGVCVYKVQIHNDEQFQVARAFDQQFVVRVCFPLPEYKTDVLKQGETPPFELNPFPEDYVSKNQDKTEGNCICVRNVPPDATLEGLQSEMRSQFGCIQRVIMQMNTPGNPLALVEFESETSKQRAIKASSVMIGDGLSLVDCHRTSFCSSSGEVSQSKTICSSSGEVSQSKTICGSKSSHMDDTGPQSLFVVVSWDEMAPGSTSILQLDTQNTNHESSARLLKKNKKKNMKRGLLVEPRLSFSDIETQLSQKEYVAHLSRPQGSAVVQWAVTSCYEKLYMLPYFDFSDRKIDLAMHGCIFDLGTKTFRHSKPPKANKFAGHVVVSPDGFIYFMAQPSFGFWNLDPAFERYDPANDEWKTLEPFPVHAASIPTSLAVIRATIALENTILYNIGGFEIWAYDVVGNKWYQVSVEDSQCYDIIGEAVVVDDKTIYTLVFDPFELVLALSVERIHNGVDLEFKCSVRSSIELPAIKGIPFEDVSVGGNDAYLITRHLVRFGKNNFCLVQSCKLKDGLYDTQPILVTKIKLKGNSMTVTGEWVHELRVPGDHYFKVGHCFSLPEEYKTTALNIGERLINFDPFRVGLEKGYFSAFGRFPSHVYGIPSFAQRASTLGDEEGHFIFVRDLPKDATFRQIEKKFKEFGLIKQEGIHLELDDKGSWSAIVEFESETSKQSAIKASPIIIKRSSVEIKDYRVSADCHGEVSQSKMMIENVKGEVGGDGPSSHSEALM